VSADRAMQLAEYWHQADESDRAIDYVLIAADQFRTRSAYHNLRASAARGLAWLGARNDDARRVDLLNLLGRGCLKDDFEAARRAFATALSLADTHVRTDAAAEAALGLARVLTEVGEMETAEPLIARVLLHVRGVTIDGCCGRDYDCKPGFSFARAPTTRRWRQTWNVWRSLPAWKTIYSSPRRCWRSDIFTCFKTATRMDCPM